MNLSILALAALIILCAAEIIIGIKKRSTALVIIGAVLGVILALSLILAIQYSDALYISDPGKIL